MKNDITNVNDCNSCDHKRNPQGGWCYMFKDEEPEKVCAQHTGGDGHIYAATSMLHAPENLTGLEQHILKLALLNSVKVVKP